MSEKPTRTLIIDDTPQNIKLLDAVLRGLGPAGRHTCAGGIRIALRYVLQRLDR